MRKNEQPVRIKKATTKDIDSIIKIQKNDPFDHSYYLTPQAFKGPVQKRRNLFYRLIKKQGCWFCFFVY